MNVYMQYTLHMHTTKTDITSAIETMWKVCCTLCNCAMHSKGMICISNDSKRKYIHVLCIHYIDTQRDKRTEYTNIVILLHNNALSTRLIRSFSIHIHIYTHLPSTNTDTISMFVTYFVSGFGDIQKKMKTAARICFSGLEKDRKLIRKLN